MKAMMHVALVRAHSDVELHWFVRLPMQNSKDWREFILFVPITIFRLSHPLLTPKLIPQPLNKRVCWF